MEPYKDVNWSEVIRRSYSAAADEELLGKEASVVFRPWVPCGFQVTVVAVFGLFL